MCNNTFIEGDVEERDNCHITQKYRGAAHRDRNINFSLNFKICIAFHNLKNNDIHLIMQKIGRFSFKIKRIRKYMSFSLDNKLVFIDSFQFLSSSLVSLVKNLCENDFKHLIVKY